MNRIGRISWGLADQVMVSFGVSLVSLQGAASLSVGEFGALSTALAAFYLMTAVTRGLVSDVYVLRFASAAGVRRDQAGAAQRAALAVSLAMSTVLLTCAAATGASTAVTGALAVATPLVLLQDLRRAILVAGGATRRSAASSALVLAVQVAGGVGLHECHRVTAPTLLLVWAAGAACGTCFVRLPGPEVPGPEVPRLSGVRAWMRSSRPYWPSMLTEALTLTGAGQVPLLVVAAVSGPDTVGGLRAATLLLAPMAVVHQACGRLILAEASRVDRSDLLRFSAGCQALFLMTWGGWLMVVASTPGPLLNRLLGENLPQAVAALPGMTAFGAANMLALGPTAVLFVSGRLGASVIARLALVPVLAGVPSLLAAAGATVGEIAAGFGLFGVCTVAVTNTVAVRVSRRRAPAAAVAGPVGSGG